MYSNFTGYECAYSRYHEGKIDMNAKKYPIDKAKGKSDKYKKLGN